MKGTTSRTLMIVTLARISLLGIWFIGNVILMKKLGPDEFGIYAMAVMCIKLFTGCFGDALDLSVMGRVPVKLLNDRISALEIVRSSFWLRIVIGIFVLCLAIIFRNAVSNLILSGQQNSRIVVLIGVGIIADMMSKSSMGFLQASQQFVGFISLESILQIGRFVAVLMLIYTGQLSAFTSVVIFSIAPLIVFILSLFLLPRDVIALRTAPIGQVLEVVRYAKWIVLSMAMAALYERVDMLLLGNYRSSMEVGLYSAALTLATIPDHFTGCISTVLQPKIPIVFNQGGFPRYMGKYFLMSAPVVIVGLIGTWLLGGIFIETFLTEKYQKSILLFQILASSSLLGMMLSPLANSLVAFIAPRFLTVMTATGLVISLTGGLIVIPRYGAYGAALLMVSARILLGLLMNVLALYLAIKRHHIISSPQVAVEAGLEGKPA